MFSVASPGSPTAYPRVETSMVALPGREYDGLGYCAYTKSCGQVSVSTPSQWASTPNNLLRLLANTLDGAGKV